MTWKILDGEGREMIVDFRVQHADFNDFINFSNSFHKTGKAYGLLAPFRTIRAAC